MITMTPDDIFREITKLPGGDTCDSIYPFASVQKIKNYSMFQQYLNAAAQSNISYDLVSHNCVSFVAETLSEMNKLFAKAHPGEPPPAWGMIGGDVPSDGDNCVESWHCLIFCFCEDALYLAGAQDREVMNQSRVSEIKLVGFARI